MKTFRCGFERAVITPEAGRTYLDGYGFRLHPSEGVYSELYVNLCAVIAGEERFLIASFDFCGMSQRVYTLIAGQIEQLTGLDRSHMALCATHTHSGPACGVLEITPVDYDYCLWVGEQAGKCAARAFAKAVPGSFDCRLPGEITFSINRRGREPIDRRVKTVAFVDENGVARGAFINLSCHAVLNTTYRISGDYPGVLNSFATDDCPAVFLAGRGADINPSGMGGNVFETIQKYGREVAGFYTDCVKNAVPDENQSDVFALSYAYVRLPVKDYPSAEELKARISVQRDAYLNSPEGSVERHCSHAELNWLYMAREGSEAGRPACLRVPLQLLKLGNIVFFFVPFELLTLTGNKLEDMASEAGFSPEKIFVVGYANSVNGYLAPLEEFAFGGYEVSGASHWYCLPECCEETEGEMLRWFADHLQD